MQQVDNPLSALLSTTQNRVRTDKRGLPEVQIQRLHEMVGRYWAPNPFRRGDLVTPRAAANLKGAGDLHIVLETIPPITPAFRSDACCGEDRLDTRIAWLDLDGDECTAWVESYRLERHAAAAPGTGDGPTAGTPTAP